MASAAKQSFRLKVSNPESYFSSSIRFLPSLLPQESLEISAGKRFNVGHIGSITIIPANLLFLKKP
jgi:hypothetical protein